MCFSATASFTAAAITGVIGIVCLARVRSPRQLLLAAVPLLFALQQCLEGALWLTLEHAPSSALSGQVTVLLFALVFWPAYAPLSLLLVEANPSRRRAIGGCVAIGAGLGLYLLWEILGRPHDAVVRHGHIVYVTENGYPGPVAIAYLCATCLPLILSSQRVLNALGGVVLVGCVVAYLYYWEAFASVWCFFAAAASAVILFHFERTRQQGGVLGA